MDDNWEKYIETIASLVSGREKYQRVLGQIALDIKQRYNIEALKELSEDVKERHGITLSPNTLHNYAWIEEKTKDLNIPDDVTFRTRQAIAGSKEPEKYVQLLLNGVSANEVFNMIKGTPKKEIRCPHCKKEFIYKHEKKN